MVIVCSVVSELSNYDSCHCLSVGAFLLINTVVILLGDVIGGHPWVVQAEMEGCKV